MDGIIKPHDTNDRFPDLVEKEAERGREEKLR
jgi:hypothetical protein